MNARTLILQVACLALLAFPACGAPHAVSLAGKWRFALDRADAGVGEGWFKRELRDSIRLPGSLPQQGIGDAPSLATKWTGSIQDKNWHLNPIYAPYAKSNDFHFPFWLQPEKHYVGAAWFQRDIEVPKEWAGQRVVLTLERPHWETRVWVDGTLIGTNDSLGTPHEYDLGALAAGRHTLTVRVDNRLIVDVGYNSHSVTDHTQGNWNGIVGSIVLRPRAVVWVDDLQVFPNLAGELVKVRGRIGNATGRAGQGTLVVRVDEAVERGTFERRPQVKAPVTWTADGGAFETEMRVPSPKTWDEFHPALYNAEAWIEDQQGVMQAKVALFGFREIGTQGTQFLLNGRKTFFRGTLECAIFPKTGHPPTDMDSWRRIIRVAKAHGLNMIRFHSWCPPEAAFVAADELGFYYQVEVSSWANSSTSLGDGKPVDAWLYVETARMLKAYGNHPSFVLMTYGNEPGGRNQARWLAGWVEHGKKTDARRLYTSGAGWPQIAENQFHVAPEPRVQAWGGGLKSRINAKPPETVTDYRDYIGRRTVPVISHEIGQWCVYPNFDEIKKYTGYLKPRNFELFRDTLRKNHMGDQARDFLHASGKLQTLCYKEDIESALRTPGMGGFQLLDLHDFPGQGTALVGVLDPFWEEKGYVTPAEFRRFCSQTVPLARLAKRVFTTDEKLEADLEVAHFGPRPLQSPALHWSLVNDAGRTVSTGTLPARTIPVDNGISIGRVSVDLTSLASPARYKFVVHVRSQVPDDIPAARSLAAVDVKHENDWDVWVYPPRVSDEVPAGLAVTRELDDASLARLKAGGKVLLLVQPSRVAPDKRLGKVALGFSSIFWNTAWTHRQPPHTLGILCDPEHPLFASFPTEAHSNWQWWHLVTRAGAMLLDDLPGDVRPQVQVIDDWVTNRRLGLYFEAKVAGGKLAVCSIDLETDLESNLVARQFRSSLLRYLGGEKFNPRAKATPEQIRALFAAPPAMQRLGARVLKASSEEQGFEAANAIDGNVNTMWHSAYQDSKPAHPHELQLQFNAPATIRACTVTPRQDHNRNGFIKDYAIFVSADATSWGEAVARGTFTRDDSMKTVWLERPARGRFVKFVALSGFDSQPFAALAEFGVVTE
jgi:hypothetical protein